MTNAMPRTQAMVLGGVVLAGVLLAAVGLFAVGDRQGLWKSRFEIKARFAEIRGVEVGTRVRVQGINAGQVAAIEFPQVRGGAVTLRFRLDSDYQPLIGRDARARIVSEGLIGSKVIEIDPGTAGTGAVQPGGEIAADKGTDLLTEASLLTRKTTEVMDETLGLVRDVRTGEGQVGREVVASMRQFQHTLESVNRGLDALKNIPLLKPYFAADADPVSRPGAERQSFVLPAGQLFEPGTVTLTAEGKKQLDTLATEPDKLPRWKVPNSELVIAAYTDLPSDERSAKLLTQFQSEAVSEYLKAKHSVQKMGSWPWQTRKVTAVGMGTQPAPGDPPAASLPPRRVEVIVFVSNAK